MGGGRRLRRGSGRCSPPSPPASPIPPGRLPQVSPTGKKVEESAGRQNDRLRRCERRRRGQRALLPLRSRRRPRLARPPLAAAPLFVARVSWGSSQFFCLVPETKVRFCTFASPDRETRGSLFAHRTWDELDGLVWLQWRICYSWIRRPESATPTWRQPTRAAVVVDRPPQACATHKRFHRREVENMNLVAEEIDFGI